MKLHRLLIGVLWLGAAHGAPGAPSVDAIGPVAPWRNRTVVTTDGVQADSPPVAPGGGQPWSPRWFTADGAEGARTIYLTREWHLDGSANLSGAMLRVSGDRSYRLWINGVLVLRGPDDPGSDVGLPPRWTHQWLYDTVDARPYLHPGMNRLSVEVVNSDTLSSYSIGHTGFALDARLRFADGREQRIDGPAGWVGIATDSYRTGHFPDAPGWEGLMFSASLEPDGWPSPTGAGAWRAAKGIANAWGELRPSMIPSRMEADWPAVAVSDAVGPVTRSGNLDGPARDITVSGDARFTLHFGRVISAYLAFEAEAAEGAVITFVPKESATQDEVARPLEVRLRDGVTTWESPGYDSFSQVEVRVTHVTTPVRIHFVRATFTSQPVQYGGSFESSDDHLNALWKAARWQTQICLQDRFLDSPNHQEPIGDPGDYLIATAQSDYAFGDPWMAAQNLRQFAALLDRNGEVTFHASYPLFWVQMLRQYYEHTGDLGLVRELKPSVDRLLDHLATYRGPNGLLSEAPNYMFMDWIQLDGYNLHHPPAVIGQGYFSALYYRGLQDGARLARLVGDEGKAADDERRTATLRSAFETELWDPAVGLYRDGKPFQNHQPLSHYFPADRAIETHTDQVNLLAALYGLASPERGRSVVQRLLRRDRLNVQPYFMHFAFDAEATTGLWDGVAWAQLQQWHLNPQTGTFREMWMAGDWSHSWGGTPLVQLSSRVLGISPDEPGYARVRVAPHALGLDWARGTVPTPHGSVKVDWKRSASGVDMTVGSEGAPVVLDVSHLGGTVREVKVDGRGVALAGSRGIDVAPGVHAIAVRFDASSDAGSL